MARAPVYLNVYDMFWLNDYASTIGVGVFHSGIEVYGTEYAYGGHPFPFSGVFENAPRDAEELGDNFRFKESICLGKTDFSPEDVRKMIQQLGHEYRGDRYHLITKNCNHFSNHLSKTLTGQELPSWINRLANISGSLPFLERWIPQEWLTPIALQQSLDRDARQSNGNGAPSSGAAATASNANAVTNRAGLNTAAIRVNRGTATANSGEENSEKEMAADKSTTSTSTAKNGTKSTQNWRWFQRRNGGGNNDSSSQNGSSASAPVTSRQPTAGESGMSPTLSRLWSSFKGNNNNTNNAANNGTTSSSSTSSSSTGSAKNNN